MANKKYTIVASAYDKRNRLIYSCTNSYFDSSSLQRYYAIKAGYPERKFNHAEIKCIYNSVVRLKQKISKLVILRVDANGMVKNSEPCNVCKLCIEDFKISNVIYSTERGFKKV